MDSSQNYDQPQKNIPGLPNEQKFPVRPKREADSQVLFAKFKPEKSNLKAYRTLIRFFLNANQQKHIPAPFTIYINQLPEAVRRKLMLCPKKIIPGSGDKLMVPVDPRLNPFAKPNPTAPPIPAALPISIAVPIPNATKGPSTPPISKPTPSTRRIFRQTKPNPTETNPRTEPTPIPVSISAQRPISTKTCRGNSKFFFEETVFYNK